EIDDHRRSACHGGSRARIEIFAGRGAHEGHLHMGMWIDTARHHVLTGGVNNIRTRWHVDIVTHGHNQTILAKHVGLDGLIGVDDRTVLYEYRHFISPCMKGTKASEKAAHQADTTFSVAQTKMADTLYQ